MPPLAEFSSFPADHTDQPGKRAFFGERYAAILGTVLLLLFLLTTAARWIMPDTYFKSEKIIQQPVAPETSTFSSQTSEVTAPDPGDAAP